MKNEFKFKVKLQSPEGQVAELNPVAYFQCNPEDYGNGYYMKLEDAGLGFDDVFDCRYDHRLKKDDLPAFVREIMKQLWTGKNGSWKIIELTELCY